MKQNNSGGIDYTPEIEKLVALFEQHNRPNADESEKLAAVVCIIETAEDIARELRQFIVPQLRYVVSARAVGTQVKVVR